MKRSRWIVLGVALAVALVLPLALERARVGAARSAGLAPSVTRPEPTMVAQPPGAAPQVRRSTDENCDVRVTIATACRTPRQFQLELERVGEADVLDRREILTQTIYRALRPGSYRLRARAAGWELAHAEWSLDGTRATEEVTLEVDPIASLHGFVRDTLTSAPIVDFRATLEERGARDGIEVVHESAPLEFHSPGGEFCVAGLLELDGAARVTITADEYDAASSDWFALGAAPFPADFVVELRPRTRAIVVITGRVVDRASGTALGGAVVQWLDADFDFGHALEIDDLLQDDRAPSGLAVHERTAPDGSFRLEVRAPQRVVLRVREPKHRELRTEAIDCREGVALAPFDLRLERGAAIFGRATVAERWTKRIRPRHIVVRGDEGERWSPIAADGTYRVDGLASGACVVALQAEDLELSRLVWPMTERVALGEGEEREIDLAFGDRTRGASVSGRVFLPSGIPWTDARVAVFDFGSDPLLVDQVSGDRFELDGLASGEFAFVARAQDSLGAHWAVALRTLEIRGARELELDLDARTPAVSFRLAGREPRPAERVLLSTDALDARARAMVEVGVRLALDSSGCASIFGLPNGRYAAKAEQSREAASFTLAPGGANLEIVLP